MSAAERDLPILRRLASMPFLDRLELAAVSGTADRSAYAAVSALERRGLAASVIHASDLLRATRRYWLTAAGLRRLAEAEGIAPDELLRAYPRLGPAASHPHGETGRGGRHLQAGLVHRRRVRSRGAALVQVRAPRCRHNASRRTHRGCGQAGTDVGQDGLFEAALAVERRTAPRSRLHAHDRPGAAEARPQASRRLAGVRTPSPGEGRGTGRPRGTGLASALRRSLSRPPLRPLLLRGVQGCPPHGT